jgi:hypothetical protein
VVEAGVFDAPGGTALVLANFTYEPIPSLRIRLPVKHAVQRVRSATTGALPFTTAGAYAKQAGPGFEAAVQCEVSLGLNDIILFQ